MMHVMAAARHAPCMYCRLSYHTSPFRSFPAAALSRQGPASRSWTARRRIRTFSATSQHQQSTAHEAKENSPSETEILVRQTKQRFRDTLPKGYLNDEEYALYERMYGPPLRETEPEDVGIPAHVTRKENQAAQDKKQGTLIRKIEGGEFEELKYDISATASEDVGQDTNNDSPEQSVSLEASEKTPDYITAIARSPREHEALRRLAQDFETAKAKAQADAKEAAAQAQAEASATTEQAKATAETAAARDEEGSVEEIPSPFWPTEQAAQNRQERRDSERFHRDTLEGRFHGKPIEVKLPQKAFVEPIQKLLERTHITHVKAAAEAAFGGKGLPTSPASVEGFKPNMNGVGLAPDQRHMAEIDADAFLACYLPPAYASALSTLHEVRRRLGPSWLQPSLKQQGECGLSVLDAGGGGAGLVAWEQLLMAEWELLKERGEVSGSLPVGKKTVVVTPERLRNRVKTFLQNTTILPRLPDYTHAGETHGEHLDAGDQPQARKTYDVVIASHLLLKEKQDHQRQAVLSMIWELVNKDGGVLIVVEKAHPRGFEALAEARRQVLKDFITPTADELPADAGETDPAARQHRDLGHIIAPCTNHEECPMYKEPGASVGRKDICSFNQRFLRPQFYVRTLTSRFDQQGDADFSFVAFRRGVPNPVALSGREATEMAFEGYEKSDTRPQMQALPRIVNMPLKRTGHVTMDVCTPTGDMERWTVPKSFSKQAYHDARKVRWGDLWAMGAKTRIHRQPRIGNVPGKGDRQHRRAREEDDDEDGEVEEDEEDFDMHEQVSDWSEHKLPAKAKPPHTTSVSDDYKEARKMARKQRSRTGGLDVNLKARMRLMKEERRRAFARMTFKRKNV